MGCFDGETCTTTSAWWECGESTVCGWAHVEINVDMNNYDATQAPNFNGEFNEWCGECFNTGTDADMDGIYTFTQYLSPKTGSGNQLSATGHHLKRTGRVPV